MRHHGVKALKIVREWGAQELQAAVGPDRNGWLVVWMSRLAGDSLKKLLRRLRFTEPLDMLSVLACVMNDSDLMKFPLKQIREHADEIRKARRQMHKQYAKEPRF